MIWYGGFRFVMGVPQLIQSSWPWLSIGELGIPHVQKQLFWSPTGTIEPHSWLQQRHTTLTWKWHGLTRVRTVKVLNGVFKSEVWFRLTCVSCIIMYPQLNISEYMHRNTVILNLDWIMYHYIHGSISRHQNQCTDKRRVSSFTLIVHRFHPEAVALGGKFSMGTELLLEAGWNDHEDPSKPQKLLGALEHVLWLSIHWE